MQSFAYERWLFCLSPYFQASALRNPPGAARPGSRTVTGIDLDDLEALATRRSTRMMTTGEVIDFDPSHTGLTKLVSESERGDARGRRTPVWVTFAAVGVQNNSKATCAPSRYP